MLDTPSKLGLPHAAQESIHDTWSTFYRVQKRLKKEGFTLLPMPEYSCPTYLSTEKLTAHNSTTLALEYARYKAWRDFTAERLMFTKQILVETKTEMEEIESNIKNGMKRRGDKKLGRTEIREEARTDSRYRQLLLQEQEHTQLQIAYETKLAAFTSSAALVSRAITMRGQDIEQGNRASKIGACGPQGREFGE